jgi:hypothetical protein
MARLLISKFQNGKHIQNTGADEVIGLSTIGYRRLMWVFSFSIQAASCRQRR